MKTIRLTSAAAAVITVAAAVTACGNGGTTDQDTKNVAWSPVTGDNFTTNSGAWQTDGVPAPAAGVTMVGDPVAAQAVANAGLPQGTITASNNTATVYYPKAPDIPGLPVSAREVAPPPAPMQRPADTRPWNYTDHQVDAYRQICDNGRWNGWAAPPDVQAQTCWTVYGRRLGVRPWYVGQPRPWQQAAWPKPWWGGHFRSDVPVMWVYPPSWHAPRPQPVIAVSITVNIPGNPHAHPNPRHRDELYYPVWAVTPGLPIQVHAQAQAVPPVLPIYTQASVSVAAYVAPPVFPGVVLGAIPATGKAQTRTALPGADVVGNVNVDAKVTTPIAAALQGATVFNGSVRDVEEAVGESVAAKPATEREIQGSAAPLAVSASQSATTEAEETTSEAADSTTSKTTTKAEESTTKPKSSEAKASESTTTTKTTTKTTESKTTTKTTESTTTTKTTEPTTTTRTTTERTTTERTTEPPTTRRTTTTVPVPEITTTVPEPVITTTVPTTTRRVIPQYTPPVITTTTTLAPVVTTEPETTAAAVVPTNRAPAFTLPPLFGGGATTTTTAPAT